MRAALVLVRVLFGFTVLGAFGVLLAATSVDAVDGELFGLLLYAAAPGVAGFVLSLRVWLGGVWVWRGLLGVQGWLLLGALRALGEGDGRGVTQMVVPVVIIVLLCRRSAREWFLLEEHERAEWRPFSISRMIRWRRDGGQTSVEYIGLLVVVILVIAGLVTAGFTSEIGRTAASKICEAVGGADCGGDGDGTSVEAGDGEDAEGATGSDGAEGPDSSASGGTEGATGSSGTDGGSGSASGDVANGGASSGGTGEDGGTATSEGSGGGGSDSGGSTGGESSGGTGGSSGGTQAGEDADTVGYEDSDDDRSEAAEGEPGWEGDAPADDGGGDEEDCGGWGFFSCAVDRVGQVGEGIFVDGIWGDITGIGDLFSADTWSGMADYGSGLGDQWSKDSKDAGEKWENGDYFDALTDWGGASVNTVGKVADDVFVGDDVRDMWNNGEKTRAASNVVWNVGSFFIPGYNAGKVASKLGKLGKLGDLGRLGKAAEKAAKAADKGRKAAEKGDAKAAGKAADEAQKHADDAAKELAGKGCVIRSAPAPARVPVGGTPPSFSNGVNAAGEFRAAYRVNGRPVVLVTKPKGCEGASQEEIDAAEKAQKDADAAKAAEKEASRKAVAKWKKPSWYGELKNPRKGSVDGGDGKWKSKKSVAYWPKMENWMRFQEQVSKVKRGKEYAVKDPKTGRDVDFDGWDSATKTYKEAKFGYGKKVRPDGTLEPAQANKFVEQARRQLRAANGKPVEWNFSNKQVAEAAQKAFDDARIRVSVKHTPWEK